ncbi:MAG: hypothetical protein NC393_02620 [Clostridium sp.]|nr:hypothetical protein [Clostridium sp.]MCM1170999.1 hypothetical protein [Clostridium sp.]MCM1208023.1 hypothetical protein [Ruminococcus sp.]
MKIIGKKRFSDDIWELKDSPVDMAAFVNKTYRELKWKQAGELTLFYKKLLFRAGS